MTSLTPFITKLVYLVPLLALCLLWGGAKLDALGARRIVTGLWLVLAALSVLHYAWPNARAPRYFNGYEHFHYYLGAKYAPELGYTGLYVATIGALDEDAAERQRQPIKLRRVRDLQTGKHAKPEQLRKQVPAAKARFTAQRWADFRADLAPFSQGAMAPRLVSALDDKGYNAPPAWTLVGAAFASMAKATSEQLYLLPWLDVGLWLFAFMAIGVTFGLRPLAVTLVVLGTQLVTDHTHLKAAFLRIDWIGCLLLAMVAQRRQRPLLAGALVGYAAMMRVFPVVFAFGAIVKVACQLLRRRRLHRQAALFLAGMTIVALALFAVSAQVYGLGYWREFLDKILPHAGAITGWRVGFRYLFVGLAGLGGWQQFYDSYSWAFFIICAALLIGCARVVDQLDDDDALAFGFFAFYLLMAPTYYYYVALLMPALWFAKHMQASWAKVGLTLLFSVGVVMHLVHGAYGRVAAVFVPLSVLCLVLFLWVWLALSRQQRRASGMAEAASG